MVRDAAGLVGGDGDRCAASIDRIRPGTYGGRELWRRGLARRRCDASHPANPPQDKPLMAAHFSPQLSDDECLARLAQAVREQDAARLGEVAQLIGQLAAIIE